MSSQMDWILCIFYLNKVQGIIINLSSTCTVLWHGAKKKVYFGV